MKKTNFYFSPVARLLALLCAVLLVFTGCTAGSAGLPVEETVASSEVETVSPSSVADYSFILPWYRTEGYNPYRTNNALTSQVGDLLFESLVVINPSFQLEYRIVQAVTVSELTVTLTVDTSYRYADGSFVTAADVAASLNAAKNSKLYGGRFAHMASAAATDEHTVTVILTQPDTLFAWLLDIPVMPAGQTDADQPLASGAYTYGETQDTLQPNPCSTEAAPFNLITLCEMTGADALANSLNIGAISLYSSEAEGLANGINSSRQANYYTNTLVFLGFNAVASRTVVVKDVDGVVISSTTTPTGSSPLLATAQGRTLINSLLDRSTLLEKVYYNRGHIATGYLNTLGPSGGYGTLSGEAQNGEAASTLEALGYRRGMDGYYYTAAENGTLQETEENRLQLRLVVYTGSSYKRYLAQLVASSLENVGIQVVVAECDSMETYLQKVSSADFDLYIGEIKLYNNMDLSAFFAEGGAASYGLALSEALTQTYTAWQAGQVSAAALEEALAAEMPWAPLLWRSGTLYFAKALEGFDPAVTTPFYGMENIRPAS